MTVNGRCQPVGEARNQPADAGRSPAGWVRTAVIVWMLIVAAVCIRAAVQPYKRTLFTTWTQAGGDWQQGRDLYRDTWRADQDQFRYSPLTAALLVPFHHMPIRLGGAIWRLLNAAVLLGGFALWLRAAPLVDTRRRQAILFLLLAPLSLSSLNNGQPNPLIIGLLLAALAAVDGERWSLAAALIALATAVKVYPLAIGLLLAAVYPRRFAVRLLLALVVAAVLPFAFQHWDYVHSQYAQWLERLGKDQRWDWPLRMAYRDLWLLIRIFHVPLTPRGYLGVQLVSAAGCALLCLTLRLRGWPRRHVLAAILVLGTCWMTLCGPATESSTYVLLAPALAWMVLRAESERWPRLLGLMTRMALVLFLFCVVRGLWPGVNRIHALGLQPQAALLLSLAYVTILVRELKLFSRERNELVRSREMNAPRYKLSIVCPAFEEEEVLPHFHSELCAVLATLQNEYEIEILYIDDGSRDSTLAYLRHLAAGDARIHYLSFSRNFGQQAALTAGMEHATGDAVITLDSDLQHPPSLIPALVQQWRKGHDIVLTFREDDPRLSYFKRLSSRAFNAVMRWLSDTPVSSAASDYRLLSRAAVDALLRLPERHRFLRGMVNWLGFRTTTVAFHPASRGAGATKYTLRRMLALAVDAMLSFSKLPLRLALVLGLLLVVLGGAFGALVLGRSLWGGDIGGTQVLLIALFLIGGAILCALGIVGEYVGRIYEQVKGRPLYLLKEASPSLLPLRASEPIAQRRAG